MQFFASVLLYVYSTLILPCRSQVCDTDLSPETLAEEHERIRAFFSAKIAEGLRLDHLLVQVDNSVVRGVAR